VFVVISFNYCQLLAVSCRVKWSLCCCQCTARSWHWITSCWSWRHT